MPKGWCRSIINSSILKRIVMEKMLSLELLNNVSEIDFVYKRKSDVKVSQRPVITSSLDCFQILKYYWDCGKLELVEEFKVLFLNRSNRVLYLLTASSGGITGTVADPRIILAIALKVAACSLILAHNHPSGSVKPSQSDEQLTSKISTAAQYLDIRVLDHLIVTSETYYSFADEGLL
jgi:DNA repair protein RadC